MALRAKLSAPREERSKWPWHKPKYLTLPASSLWQGERRMEAENYLSGGYGVRLALEAKLSSENRLGTFASVWQPSRLKGITVTEEFGTPFLAATQVFDLRPVPRKFLSLDRTSTSSDRFISPGTIMVTCSGSVGRATLATDSIQGVLISHDLLRIAPIEPSHRGWIYAYLRSAIARAMMTSARYGHIIKHLEPNHLMGLPIPDPVPDLAGQFEAITSRILADRNAGYHKFIEAEAYYLSVIGSPAGSKVDSLGYSVSSAQLTSGRRRLEGAFHNPWVGALYRHFKSIDLQTETVRELGFRCWLPGRFPRIPAEEGVQLVGSANLFEINPDLPKRIADINFGDETNGRVKAGWLLLARSGQTYGLNGNLIIANKFHEGKVISDDAIRIAPLNGCTAREGYVYVALSHPSLGRPIVKSVAYGSSIPHIDVEDVYNIRIPRLSTKDENHIADLAEEGARLCAEADILENEMADMMDNHLAGYVDGRGMTT